VIAAGLAEALEELLQTTSPERGMDA